MAEQPADNRPIVVQFRVSLPRLHGPKATMPGCRPGDRGSIPRGVAKLTRCGPGEGRLLREQENAGSNPVVATIREANVSKSKHCFVFDR